jgi:acyl-coenzyme A synthetase/AMP-(fatty) acid ligase
VPAGAVGTIAVSSPYLGGLAADDLSNRLVRDGEMYTYYTSDLGRMAEDGCLTLVGRSDSAL